MHNRMSGAIPPIVAIRKEELLIIKKLPKKGNKKCTKICSDKLNQKKLVGTSPAICPQGVVGN